MPNEEKPVTKERCLRFFAIIKSKHPEAVDPWHLKRIIEARRPKWLKGAWKSKFDKILAGYTEESAAILELKKESRNV